MAIIRPPVKWHGGKHYLARFIASKFPEHHTYVEPFGGAASVLLNKQPSPVEVYNDLDHRLTNLFGVLRDFGPELQRRLSLTPYSEVEFENCALEAAEDFPEGDPIERARLDFVCWRQSIGGRGDAWSYTLHRPRRGMADVVSGYLSAIDEQLPLITERLRRVQIVCRPAIEVIARWDSPQTLIYCDPPYVVNARSTAQQVYRHDMTDADHQTLAATLNNCQSKVILSGYQSELYERLYQGWGRLVVDLPNNAAGGKKKARMQEVLWFRGFGEV